MESSCCFKVSPFQLLTFSLIFFALYHVYDASFEEDQLNQEANRLGVAIVTDDHFVKENFGGNSDAAFNHTINLFQAKKETLESIFNHTFGFDLLAIKLGHPAFSQIDLEQQTSPGVINVTELKSSVRLREALSTELFAYPLVLYMTNRAFSDGHYGLKLGSADSPPHNLVAVSLSGLGLQNGSFSDGLGRKRTPSKRLLISMIHELLHGVGLPHSNNTDNDLMKEFSPVGLNMSANTRTLAEMLFQAAQDEGLLSPPDDTVRLVTYSADGQPNEKLFSYQNVVEYMLERQTGDRLSFWTQIWNYVSQLPMLFWLIAFLFFALPFSIFLDYKWPTSTPANEVEKGEKIEMSEEKSPQNQCRIGSQGSEQLRNSALSINSAIDEPSRNTSFSTIV